MTTIHRPRPLLPVLLVLGASIGIARAQAVSLLDSSVTQVAAGGVHTCALTTTGGVQCWGGNYDGQLGDGATTDRAVPVATTGLGDDVVSLALGVIHSCALNRVGGVKCWGNNGAGQLGDGTRVHRSVPTDVVDLASGVVALTAGWTHTCALTAAGGVKCWGTNDHGQLGDGTTEDRALAADVTGLSSDVVAVAVGNRHSCALDSAGGVKCWGDNQSGQLGDGTTLDRVLPTDVVGLDTTVVAIAARGAHTCAVTDLGAVKCWGANDRGQLGDGTVTASATPVDVAGLDAGVSAIALGESHTCALTASGAAKCWGWNLSGQVGGGPEEWHAPVDVPGLASGVAALTAGHYHTCALRTEGSIECWGANGVGQLGRGTTTAERNPEPKPVIGFSRGVLSFASGYYHNCALTGVGTPSCWGYNNSGQLGDGQIGTQPNPTPFTPPNLAGLGGRIAAFAAGGYHTCVKTTAGGAKCWGHNGNGQLGDGSTTRSTAPVDVAGLGGVSALSAGSQYTCAVTTGGAAKCWGWNGRSQLGDGTTTDRPLPTTVAGLGSGVAAVAAGDSHTCALTTSGGVRCWGYNFFGQLGNGGGSDRSTPVDVTGLASGATAVAVGTQHSCALLSNRTVKCWGNNDLGQLGHGSTPRSSSTPVDVIGLGDVQAIASGAYHACALTGSGAVKCWGRNDHGQLGDGSAVDSPVPVGVPGLGSGVTAIAAGYFHTCALTAQGRMTCWGDNDYGTLGNGANDDSHVPASVRASQSIAFAPAAGVPLGGRIALAAATSSGGAANFDSWTPETCVVEGSSLRATRRGLCGVRASLPGHTGADRNGYAPAPQQLRLLRVTRGVQSIGDFGATPPDPVYAPDGRFQVSARGGDSGNAVVFSVDPASASVCSIEGGTLTILAAGTCSVLADQAGNDDYDQATQARLDVVVARAPQVVTFAAAPALAVGATATVSAGSAEPNSGRPIVYSVAPPSICSVDGAIVRGIGAGDCTVTARQAGDGNYLDGEATQTVVVARGSQSIAFPPQQPDRRTFAPGGTFPVEPLAVGGASGNAVTYASSNPQVCTVAGTTVTILGAGDCVLAADQAGNADYEPAAQATQTVVIDKAPQTLSFGPAPAIVAGGTGVVSAGSAEPNSGQPIVFSAAPATICTIEGATVSGVGAGDCVVTARQDGDGDYLDGSATQTIAIARAPQASLAARVSDGRDYARYGRLLNYLVTVTNSGDGDASDLHVGGALPPQLDAAYASWICLGAGGGASCADGGDGALDDAGVTIPAGRSLTWLVTAPVRLDAGGATIDYRVGVADDAAQSTDSDTLVVSRSGFDVPYGDGAEGEPPAPARACTPSPGARIDASGEPDAMHALVVPPPGGTLIDTLLRGGSDATGGFRVERLNDATSPRLRLVAIDADGRERAGAWATTASGTRIALGIGTGDGDRGVLLLEGTQPPLQMPLPVGPDLPVFRCD